MWRVIFLVTVFHSAHFFCENSPRLLVFLLLLWLKKKEKKKKKKEAKVVETVVWALQEKNGLNTITKPHKKKEKNLRCKTWWLEF